MRDRWRGYRQIRDVIVKPMNCLMMCCSFIVSFGCPSLVPLHAGSSKSVVQQDNQQKPSQKQSEAQQKKRYRQIQQIALAGKTKHALDLCDKYLLEFGQLGTQSHLPESEVSVLDLLQQQLNSAEDNAVVEQPVKEVKTPLKSHDKSLSTAVQQKNEPSHLQEVRSIAALLCLQEQRYDDFLHYFSAVSDPDLIALHLNSVLAAATEISSRSGGLATKKAWYQVMVLSQHLMAEFSSFHYSLGQSALLLARIRSECVMSKSCPLPPSYDSGDPCSLTNAHRRALVGDLIGYLTGVLQEGNVLREGVEALAARMEHSPSLQLAMPRQKRISSKLLAVENLYNYFGYHHINTLVKETGRLAKTDLPGQFPLHDISVWNYIEQVGRLAEGKNDARDQLFQLLQHTKSMPLKAFILASFLSETDFFVGSIERAPDRFAETTQDTTLVQTPRLADQKIADAGFDWYDPQVHALLDATLEVLNVVPLEMSLMTYTRLAEIGLQKQSFKSDPALEGHQTRTADSAEQLAVRALAQLLELSRDVPTIYAPLRLAATSRLVELLASFADTKGTELDPMIKVLGVEFSQEQTLPRALTLQAHIFLKENNYFRALENYQHLLSLSPNMETTPVLQAQCGLLSFKIGELQQAWGYLDRALRQDALAPIAKEQSNQYGELYRNAWKTMVEINYVLMDDPASKKFANKRLPECFSRFFDETNITAEYKALWLTSAPLDTLVANRAVPGDFLVTLQRVQKWQANFLKYSNQSLENSSVYQGFNALMDLMAPVSLVQSHLGKDEDFLRKLGYFWSASNTEDTTEFLEEKGRTHWLAELLSSDLSKEEKDRFLQQARSLFLDNTKLRSIQAELDYARILLYTADNVPLQSAHQVIAQAPTLLLDYSQQVHDEILTSAQELGLHLPHALESILMDPCFDETWAVEMPSVRSIFLLNRMQVLAQQVDLLDQKMLAQSPDLLQTQKNKIQERRRANQFLSVRISFYKKEFAEAEQKLLELRTQMHALPENNSFKQYQDEEWSYKLYLALAQELSQNKQHEAFETYVKLLEQLRDHPTKVWTGLQMHCARVGVQSLGMQSLQLPLERETETINTTPRVRQILDLYQQIVDVRDLETEPLHLESALESVFLRAQLENQPLNHSISLLREVRKTFSQERDIESLEYYQQLQLLPAKKPLYETYLLLLDAMIAHLEYTRPLQHTTAVKDPLSSVEDQKAIKQHGKQIEQITSKALYEIARALYTTILAEDAPMTPFLSEHARYGLQQLSKLSPEKIVKVGDKE